MASCATQSKDPFDKEAEGRHAKELHNKRKQELVLYQGGSGFPTSALVNAILPKYQRKKSFDVAQTEVPAYSAEGLVKKEAVRELRKQLRSFINDYRARDPDSQVIYPQEDIAAIIDRSKRGIVIAYIDSKDQKIKLHTPTLKRLKEKDKNGKEHAITFSFNLNTLGLNCELIDKTIVFHEGKSNEWDIDVKADFGAFGRISGSGDMEAAAGAKCVIRF